ncbi:LysE family translocator [Vibrio gallaecicus]|uniref:LysE family translocator n=1 Tax=Vibrio gallaecicus TaxID=552386 RepID=UPI0025B4DBBE|nr:LysE family translocator [Vibrio gallaecicus]MDN3617348.1 LysE family translocator [Vibrio gallaecicus]
MSPGPNVILVLKNSVQYGWKSALITIFGNLCCQLVIIALVAFGIGELLVRLPAWFVVMKLFGGAYLIYLGVKSLCSVRSFTLPSGEYDKGAVPKSTTGLFVEAFVVSASNPKTMIFLSAFLPQFLDVAKPYVGQFSIMYITICAIVTIVHLLYSYGISYLSRCFSISNFERKLSKVTAGLFISMGSGVLLSSRA